MKIIPAIDLIDGKCVRLTKGDYQQISEYNTNPLEQAELFASQGADMLHIVDLDAAKSGKPENLPAIFEIRSNIPLPLQVGGGIRDIETAHTYLDMGIDRIILGTKAVQDPDFVSKLITDFGAKRIVVGVDVYDNEVAISGWTKGSGISYTELCNDLHARGVQHLVVTDISKDGTLTEPNFQLIEEITQMGFSVIASGGVSSVSAIETLIQKNTWGAIIGKALYENKITLPEITNLSR